MIYRKMARGWIKQRVLRSPSSQDRLYSLEGYYWLGTACSRTLRFGWILVGFILGLGVLLLTFLECLLWFSLLLVSLVTKPGVGATWRLKRGLGAQN